VSQNTHAATSRRLVPMQSNMQRLRKFFSTQFNPVVIKITYIEQKCAPPFTILKSKHMQLKITGGGLIFH